MQGYGYARRFDSASLAIVNLLEIAGSRERPATYRTAARPVPRRDGP
nr:MAG TPA: hypothetical protein [Caudoviricetes sp.]